MSALMNHRRLLLFSVPLLAAALSLFFYLTSQRYVETDNAYLKADKVMIAPEVSGAVVEVLVSENQPVVKGQPLFRLDTAPFVAARDKALAHRDKVENDIRVLQAALRSKQAEQGLTQTNVAFAEKEYRRQVDLARQHFVSQVQLDDHKHALDLSRQQLRVMEQEIERLLASLNHSIDAPVAEYPVWQEAAAELAQAQINLDRTTVYAPFEGVVSNVPKLGQHLNTGSPALALVANQALWIDANFNEIDLTHVAAGQTVAIQIDMYPDLHWTGKVASISPASGAEFSILPAQNASGNWVKVVQRITVRVELDALEPAPAAMPVLRAGMSARVDIDTGRNRLQRLLGR